MRFDFKNSNGDTLSGNLELPLGLPRAYALFAHCFTCSKNIIAASTIAKGLTQKGIGVLRFDFTGLGNSDGDFSNTNFSSNVDDLLSAFNAIKENFEAPQILIGHSLGGAAVLKACQSLSEIKAVVTIGAPSNVEHVKHLFANNLETIKKEGQAEVSLAGRKFNLKQQFLEDLSSTNILDGLKEQRKAFLVMHSPFDDTVSIDHAGVLFQSLMHPKSFISLDEADHLLMKKEDAVYVSEVIAGWVGRYIQYDVEKPSELEGQVLVSSRENHKFTQDIYTKDHHLVADEPKSYKGNNLGMSPYDLLLAGLGACTSMTMRMYADHKKLPLETVEVHLDHKKIHAEDCADCENKSGKIDQITKIIKITGDLTDEEKEKLYAIAEKCPVNKTLHSEIKMISKH